MERTLSQILEEVTDAELALDLERAKALREEARNHPDAAAGRDLPPVTGSF